MGITIKQLADELGVSKTAIRKKIANLGLQTSLQKNGNKFTVDEKGEESIRQAFSETRTETGSQTKTQTDTQTENPIVSVMIEMLQKELDTKNEQIAELQKSLDQSQKLQAMTMQKLEVLEDNQMTVDAPKKRRWFWQRKDGANDE